MVLKQSEEYERYVIKLNLILPGTPILLPKKKTHKKVHIVWFHLDKVLKQVKLIYGDWSQKASGQGGGGIISEKELKGTFPGVMEMFYILVLDSDHTGIYNYQKSLNQVFKTGHFVCKL